MRTTPALLALLLASSAHAVDPQPQKSVAGFVAMLVVTPDKDWEQQWNTTPERITFYQSGQTIHRGSDLYVVTMFSNPQLDADGAVSVVADIDVMRPDGKASSHAENAVCTRGKLTGPASNFYICGQVVEFTGEPQDPLGTWSVEIVVKDEVRKVGIPLSTDFVLAE
jgi:hypothetical protein